MGIELTEKQRRMAIYIGEEFQANLSSMTMGEARRSLAYDVFGVERWVHLTTEQRDILTDL